MGGSFFNASSIPEGYDLMLLSGCIHDWDDHQSVEILRAARSKLPVGGRLVVVDMAVDTFAPMASAVTRMDVFMSGVAPGLFRTEAEYVALFRKAGFRVAEVLDTRSINTVFVLERE